MQRNRSTLSFIFLITLILTGVWTSNSRAQSNDEPETILSAPLPGQAVQGLIQITGELELENYSSYELSFSFSGHDTWFPITTDNTISENNLLGEWDTSAITDGNYDLKISVYFNDQDPFTEIIEGIRVRNYSAIETDTPQPTIEAAPMTHPVEKETPPTPEEKISPSPTPLPANQANYAFSDLQDALTRGGIFGIILFAFLALIFLRKSTRR